MGEMIFDEGHFVAGKLRRQSVLKDWPVGSPRRKLFFTATPVRRGIGEMHFNMHKDFRLQQPWFVG